MVTAAQVRAAAKARVNEANMNSVLIALDRFVPALGLDKPHRQAHLLAQVWAPALKPGRRAPRGRSGARGGVSY